MVNSDLSLSLALGCAVLADLLLGDPRWFPHPVRLIGWCCSLLEQKMRRVFVDPARAGLLTVIAVLSLTGVVSALLLIGMSWWSEIAGFITAILLLYFSLALRDLLRHSRQVAMALEQGRLPLARQRVAMIVGRDTESLDSAAVVRACVESVAENMGDGIVAPLFWATAGGAGAGLSGVMSPPAGAALVAMVYKAISTMDSMFGYKNDTYIAFGKTAARLDDWANFLPARLAALSIVAAAWLQSGTGIAAWRIFLRDRFCHASPNSGSPESAMAGALGIQLGGPSTYKGVLSSKPHLGDPLCEPQPLHIHQANRLVFLGSLLAVLFFTFSAFFLML